MAQFFANRGYAVLAAELPRLDRLRQEVPQRRQQRVGRQDAGRPHLGRQASGRARASPIRSASPSWAARTAATRRSPASPSRPTSTPPAVSIVGPSNLITLLDSIPPYWEAGGRCSTMRMGDPTTPDGKKQLERQSPLNSAAKIKTPLLVVQGANDPRVKKAESDQIVVALRDRGSRSSTSSRPTRGTASRARSTTWRCTRRREVPVQARQGRATRRRCRPKSRRG